MKRIADNLVEKINSGPKAHFDRLLGSILQFEHILFMQLFCSCSGGL